MIIVDTALAKREAEGRPIRVGMLGAGFVGSGAAVQIIQYTQGMTLAAIACRRVEQGMAVYENARVDNAVVAHSRADLDNALRRGIPVVTEDHLALAQSDGIDVILDMTGSIDFALEVALAAFAAGKHVVQMNAELDGTVGPLLKAKADQAGVIYTFTDGDQPGVELNLYRFAKQIGAKPVLCGNLKGLHDPYRNPATQAAYAAKWRQKPHMVTSFADGTKISFEQAVVANATGMRVARRGMIGPDYSGGNPDTPSTLIENSIHELIPHIDPTGPGIVDYVVGARPGPGVFVIGYNDDPRQQHYFNLYKMGAGPYYCFYTPYHLCHFEVPISIARTVLFGDAVVTSAGPPMVGVIAMAKKPLAKGEVLDGLGGFCVYGVAENADVIANERLLPIGLCEGVTLTRAIAKDEPLKMSDIAPAGRPIDRFYAEQEAHFGLNSSPSAA
jgi:predicted homoserine dehydrogenase-like protein